MDCLTEMDYEPVVIGNLQVQLEALNHTTFSDREMDHLLNHLARGKTSLRRPGPCCSIALDGAFIQD